MAGDRPGLYGGSASEWGSGRKGVGGTMIYAQSFEQEFKDWFSEGAISSVVYVVVVLAVVALVLSFAGRR